MLKQIYKKDSKSIYHKYGIFLSNIFVSAKLNGLEYVQLLTKVKKSFALRKKQIIKKYFLQID